MPRISHNIVANFTGRVWSMLIGVALVPTYLSILGAEAYGLIGFYAALQSALGILDLGLSLTLNRELARASMGITDASHTAILVRTVEVCYWSLALIGGGCIVALAPWLAEHWIKAQTLDNYSIKSAVRAMGIVVALQAPFSLYTGGLLGLQRQVLVNVIIAGAATIRAVGALAILWFVSATVDAYFDWQIVVAGLGTLSAGLSLWRFLPAGARFRPSALREIAPFAFSVSANAILGLALTQTDKLLLSHMLSLRQFGYYTLAGLVASALSGVFGPVNTALFPRFAQLAEIQDTPRLALLYHQSTQLIAVLLFPISFVLALCPHQFILAWSGHEEVAANTAGLMALLVLGTMLNGVSSVAGYMLSASGRPDIMLKTNAGLALVLIPGLMMTVPVFGAVAAALLWIALTGAQLIVVVAAAHRLILKGEFSRWLTKDMVLPAISAVSVILVSRALVGEVESRFLSWAVLLVTWALATAAALAAAGETRIRAVELGSGLWRRLHPVH